MKKFNLDKILLVFLVLVLILHWTKLIPIKFDDTFLLTVSIIGTIPTVASAWLSLKKKQISVDLLASIALIASLLTRQWSSAVFINLMLTSARIFASFTEGKARSALQSLLKLRPNTVKIKIGGASGAAGSAPEEVKEIKTDDLEVGQLVIIELGERIPVDGVIVEGEAGIDQSSLTGESLPVDKRVGDKVFSSTLNTSGSLIVKAEKVGKDTMLQKIIDLVENAQKGKAKIKTIADKFATWYIVLTLAGAIAVYAFTHDMLLLLSLLLVACADDIAVALPMAFLAATGYAAKRGVIIKGGAYLEAFTKIKILIADKTGTVTTGKMKVAEVKTFGGHSEQELLSLALGAENFSEHPVAKEIRNYAIQKRITAAEVENVEEMTSQGLKGTYKGKGLICGKLSLVNKHFSVPSEQLHLIEQARSFGYSLTVVGLNKELIGFLALSDTVRPGVKAVFSELKSLGILKTVMLTGDNEKVAKTVATSLGFNEFKANLLPQDKLEEIKKNQQLGSVAMIGDGVNDAAALSLADVGIAMGAIGSDTAIEAADIALMRDDLRELPEIYKLGQYTLQIARQDFWIWGTVNLVGLILVFTKILNPVGASAYNFVTDFFPLLNSMRLFSLHLQMDKPIPKTRHHHRLSQI